MTVRNVRAHQSRGLLPPPEIRGRTGYYGPEHVDRLELIKDLQAEGFSLEVIRRILDRAPGATAAEVLDFTRAVAEPFGDEQPELVERRRARRALGRPAHARARASARRSSASCGRSATGATRS